MAKTNKLEVLREEIQVTVKEYGLEIGKYAHMEEFMLEKKARKFKAVLMDDNADPREEEEAVAGRKQVRGYLKVFELVNKALEGSGHDTTDMTAAEVIEETFSVDSYEKVVYDRFAYSKEAVKKFDESVSKFWNGTLSSINKGASWLANKTDNK